VAARRQALDAQVLNADRQSQAIADLRASDTTLRAEAAAAVAHTIATAQLLREQAAHNSQMSARLDHTRAVLEDENRRLLAEIASLQEELDSRAADCRPPTPKCVERVAELLDKCEIDDAKNGLALSLLKGVGRALHA